MIKSQIALIALVLLLSLSAQNKAFAQATDSGGFFGAVHGYSVPDADSTNPHQISGFNGGAKLLPNFAIGAYYLQTTREEGSAGRTFDYSLHGLEALMHITTSPKDIFLGLRMGLSKVRTDINGLTTLLSPYHYGIVGGYNYMVIQHLSLGFEGSYLAFQSSSVTVNGTPAELKSFHVMNFLATLKIWL